MLFYSSFSDLADNIIQISELDYDYAYNLEDLRQGYYILKRRNGSKQELLKILNNLKNNLEIESSIMLIRYVGDHKKEKGLKRLTFIEEGGNAISGEEFLSNSIRLIHRKRDDICWEKFYDFVTLEHDKLIYDLTTAGHKDDPDLEGVINYDIYRYKGKEIVTESGDTEIEIPNCFYQ